MRDIQDVRLLWLKFTLFVSLGLLALTVAYVLFPDLRLLGLSILAIWSFCRAYYFAFYVIEHYIDPSFRFAGLGHFIQYALGDRTRGKHELDP